MNKKTLLTIIFIFFKHSKAIKLLINHFRHFLDTQMSTGPNPIAANLIYSVIISNYKKEKNLTSGCLPSRDSSNFFFHSKRFCIEQIFKNDNSIEYLLFFMSWFRGWYLTSTARFWRFWGMKNNISLPFHPFYNYPLIPILHYIRGVSLKGLNFHKMSFRFKFWAGCFEVCAKKIKGHSRVSLKFCYRVSCENEADFYFFFFACKCHCDP